MKWYNTNKTKMLDLDSVKGYVYISAEDYINQDLSEVDVNDFKEHGDKIELIIGGSIFIFRGEQAKELYNLLLTLNNKEVLKG